MPAGRQRFEGVGAVLTLAMLCASAAAAAPEYSTVRLEGYRHPVTGVWYEPGELHCAMPLGGLGTGYVELTPEGFFQNSTLQGNPRPTGTFPDSFLLVRTQSADGQAAVRHIGTGLGSLPGLRGLRYFGHFPIVDMRAQDDGLPIEVSLRALTPFIKGDSKNSALPAAIVRVSMRNPTNRPVETSALMSWQNDIRPPGRETGNVGGFLTWRLGDIPAGQRQAVTMVTAWAPSVEQLRQLLQGPKWRPLAVEHTLPLQPPPTQESSKALGQAIFVDWLGGFNWEAKQQESFMAGGTPNIGQEFWGLSWDDGGRKHIGTDFRPGEPSAPVGQLAPAFVRSPLPVRSEDEPVARVDLSSPDGPVGVSIAVTRATANVAIRTVEIAAGERDLHDVEFSHYVNLDVGGPTACEDNEGWFDPALQAVIVRNRTTGAAMCLAAVEGELIGYGIGPWHDTLNRMHAGTYDLVRDAVAPDQVQLVNEPLRHAIGLRMGVSGRPDGYTLGVPPAEGIEPLQARSWRDRDELVGDFAEDGALQPSGDGPNAAVAAHVTIPPGETRHVDFVLAWYFPDLRDTDGRRVGHRYATWFSSPEAVLTYVGRRRDDLIQRTIAWQDDIYGQDIPGWLQDAKINGLYSLARNTWWIEDGRFAHSESFTGCPIMETIVCRFNGSWPIAEFFPDRERSVMMQFAGFQRDDGAIPFAFGAPERMDAPYYDTQKSLDSSEFVLMAYRDWQIMGAVFLRDIYPSVKRAVRYCQTLDTDGDGIINEVSMQYYDVWQFHGTSAYVGSIWLAALRAAERLAEASGDGPFADECGAWFARAQHSFEAKLWNGRYYRLYNEPETGKVSEVCLGNQLVGQWWASQVGLGEILAHEHIVRAVDSVLRLNGANTPYGVANGVRPDGTREPGPHADCVSPGETWAFAATAIAAGRESEGLAEAREACANVALVQRLPWDIHFSYSAADGRMIWGSHYYSNMSIWTVAGRES